jgi:hypothetical protein
MAELLILEFEGIGEAEYRRVNAALGVDVRTGAGDWPPPLLCHSAAQHGNGLMVVEVWESREAQGEFMSRLAPALQQGGIDRPPSRMEWFPLIGHYQKA